MKILNLFPGLGGNRKLWMGHQITAVEIDKKIGAAYAKMFPGDEIIIGDAYQYLLENYKDFDFIWASPPCQSHSRFCYVIKNKKYPDFRLYELIVFLRKNFTGSWIVENVIPYYDPLIIPNFKIDRHLFWCNFFISDFKMKKIKNFANADKKTLEKWLGISCPENIYYEKNASNTQVLRNCIHPFLGEHILNSITNSKVKNPNNLIKQILIEF